MTKQRARKPQTLRWMALLTAVLLGAGLATETAAGAATGHASFSLAVYGDAPYGTTPTDNAEFTATPAFVDSVNADPDVSAVVHVGDIHSGKQYCTRAYDQAVAGLWSHYTDPLVYTPGDNEWSDCHKVGEGGGLYNASTGNIDYVLDPTTHQPVDYAKGDPTANLALIRSTFFTKPGRTLGSGTLHVVSQAQAYDRRHPADAQFIENVLWVKNNIVFVTVNVPGGSNNDADPWYGTPTETPQQATERAQRTDADVRWLDTAFRTAHNQRAAGVVVITQADMWDLGGNSVAHLANYEPIVSSLATHTTAFGGPVLLFTGDSHTYRSDNPLQQGAPCAGDAGVCAAYDSYNAHPYYNVPNFHRIVVHGSTFPLEWLKLTITPKDDNPTTDTSFGPFTWQRMPQP